MISIKILKNTTQIKNAKYYKLFDVTKSILVRPTFQQIQQSLSRTRCGMKSLHSVLKLLSNET